MSDTPTPMSLEEILARLSADPAAFRLVEGGSYCVVTPADRAAGRYAASIGDHASEEQLAVFWSEFPDAKKHRDAIDFIQKRGIEECIAQPLTPGAW